MSQRLNMDILGIILHGRDEVEYNNFSYDNQYEKNKQIEIDSLNELFNESAELCPEASPSDLDKLVTESLSNLKDYERSRRLTDSDAIYWTKTSTDPKQYERTSFVTNFRPESGIRSFKYRRLDAAIVDSDKKWASVLSEYVFIWDEKQVMRSTLVEKSLPEHTLEEVEMVSDIISYNFADRDQLGDELYEKLEELRDPALVTPRSETSDIRRDDIDMIIEQIKNARGIESSGWVDDGRLHEQLYRNLGALVDEIIKNRAA